MKKLTIIVSLLFFCVFASMVTYVSLSEDFVMPVSLNEQEGISQDSPIWDKDMDDLIAYLADKGLIDASEYGEISSGIATVARIYSDVDFYWWDTKSLEKGSDEYTSYITLQGEGYIDLWGSGMIMYLEKHGPFGIDASRYNGDIEELMEAFRNYY